MLAFILRRLVQAMVVMIIVAFFAFMLFQYVGDPVVFLLGQDATPDQIRQLRIDLGLDRSFVVQFWHFLSNAVQGEFGLSLRQGAKVSRLLAERFPATLELALVAALLALAVGIPMGVYAASRQFWQPVSNDGVVVGCFTAYLSYRHRSDPGFFSQSGLVSKLWQRRNYTDWLVDDRTSHGQRLAPYRDASSDPGHFSIDTHHAPGSR